MLGIRYIQIRFRSDIWREQLWTTLLRESDLLDWGGLCTGQLAAGLLPGRLFRWPELHPHAAAGARRGARPPDDLGPLVPPCGYHPDSQHSQTTKLCSAKLLVHFIQYACQCTQGYQTESPCHWGLQLLTLTSSEGGIPINIRVQFTQELLSWIQVSRWCRLLYYDPGNGAFAVKFRNFTRLTTQTGAFKSSLKIYVDA